MSLSRHHLFHALKWSAAGELASRLILPLVFLILARLLIPEDFGVMAAATMVISFSQVFWEAGMGKALIQRQQDVREAADVAFWINIALGVLIAGLIFVAAEPVAKHVFKDERVTLVLQVMILQVILASLVSVHTALLQKEFRFKSLFWVRLLTVALPAFASIAMAMHGWSYWALVAGTLIGQGIQTAVLWRVHEWRPHWTFDLRVAREITGFGAWVGLSGLLAWFYVWADALVVGIYLGAHDLGLYRTGNQFVIMLFGIVFAPMLPVLYSHFSEIQADRERLKETYGRVVKMSIVVAIPAAFILFAASEPLGVLFFGDAWAGIGFVIGIMALTHGASWIIGANGEVYRAIGRPAIETISMGATVPAYIVAYLVSIKYGFEEFIWTRYLLAVAATFAHLLLVRHVIGIRILPILSFIASIALAASAVFPIGFIVSFHVEDAISQSILIVVISMIVVATVFHISGMWKTISPLLTSRDSKTIA